MLALLDPTSQLLGGRIIVGEALGAAPARPFTQVRQHVEVTSSKTASLICVTLQV